MFDLIHEIAQTLRNNRLRTFLTGISVAWGIFMLIVLLGAARGVTNSFNENMGSMDYNTVNVWQGITSKPWKGYKDGQNKFSQIYSYRRFSGCLPQGSVRRQGENALWPIYQRP